MALLDWERPGSERAHLAVARALVELLDDRPVAHLAGLGHGQELEAVEWVVLASQVRLPHLGGLLLDLAGLLQDRRLLTVERTRHLDAALLGLAGLRPCLRQLLRQRLVL